MKENVRTSLQHLPSIVCFKSRPLGNGISSSKPAPLHTHRSRCLPDVGENASFYDLLCCMSDDILTYRICRCYGNLSLFPVGWKKSIFWTTPSKPVPLNKSDAELIATDIRDFMSRLKATGVPCTTLLIQYRIHPQIAHCVSRLFYDGQLVNYASVESRPADTAWTSFVSHFMPFRLSEESDVSRFVMWTERNSDLSSFGRSSKKPAMIIV